MPGVLARLAPGRGLAQRTECLEAGQPAREMGCDNWFFALSSASYEPGHQPACLRIPAASSVGCLTELLATFRNHAAPRHPRISMHWYMRHIFFELSQRPLVSARPAGWENPVPQAAGSKPTLRSCRGFRTLLADRDFRLTEWLCLWMRRKSQSVEPAAALKR